MDLVNCALAPFLLMICFSFLLIRAIFESRRRVRNPSNSARENLRLRQDIKYAVSSLSMNLLFFILNLPVQIELALPFLGMNDFFLLTLYLYYMAYSVNFYIILFTNSLVRKQVFSLFISKKNNTQIFRNGIQLARLGPTQTNRQTIEKDIQKNQTNRNFKETTF